MTTSPRRRRAFPSAVDAEPARRPSPDRWSWATRASTFLTKASTAVDAWAGASALAPTGVSPIHAIPQTTPNLSTTPRMSLNMPLPTDPDNARFLVCYRNVSHGAALRKHKTCAEFSIARDDGKPARID